MKGGREADKGRRRVRRQGNHERERKATGGRSEKVRGS